ncbi:sulfotransferase [Aestuariibius insulae]|uniref:sulfotransferase family protein n=1 Tax=Aestuariibius insulae TaxID=2058287 RepID=UPI00345ECEDC
MRNCVVVTGAGRSGTSMVTGLLSRAGLRLSEDLIGASEQNPKGAFEDRTILHLQRDMLARFAPPKIPPPEGWLSDPTVLETEAALRSHVVAAIQEDPATLWGFKDPNTAYTLPLWSRIFEAEHITPRIVLAVRDPVAVMASMADHYGTEAAIAEMFWLTKYLAALRDTNGEVFVAHYERLVAGDEDHRAALLSFCGLEPELDRETSPFIDPALNRSAAPGQACSNPLVARLWTALQSISGAEFDRDALLTEVKAIETDLNAARGWLEQIYRERAQWLERAEEQAKLIATLQGTKAALKSKLDDRTAERNTHVAEAARMRRERDKAVAKSRLQATQIDGAKSQLEQARARIERLQAARQAVAEEHRGHRQRAMETRDSLRRKVDALSREIGAVKASRARHIAVLTSDLEAVRGSASFQLGHILMRGLRQPGRNTLAVPIRVARLFRSRKAKGAGSGDG